MTPVLFLGWRLADLVKDVPAVGATYPRRSSARRPEMLGFAVSLKKECQMYGTDPIAPHCDRYIGKRSRTHDQMVQAARPASADDVAEWVRAVHDGRAGVGAAGNRSIESTRSTYAEISANGALALPAVACSLLDRQIAALERSFVEEGGFTERLHRVRTARRSSSS